MKHLLYLPVAIFLGAGILGVINKQPDHKMVQEAPPAEEDNFRAEQNQMTYDAAEQRHYKHLAEAEEEARRASYSDNYVSYLEQKLKDNNIEY